MSQEIRLRRGPARDRKQVSYLESESRFVVHYQTDLPGPSAAKAALRLPLMFGKRVHARKMALPSGIALFEVRPDAGMESLPGNNDSVEEMRDAVMNFVRGGIGRQGGRVAACYHTYRRASDAGTGDAGRDNEIFPSGQLFLEFNAAIPEAEQRRVLRHYGLLVDRAITYRPGAFVVSVTQETGTSPVRLAQELQALTFKLRAGKAKPTDEAVFEYADPLFHRRREFQAMPTDGLFRLQWHLRNDGFGGGVAGADIKATEAWDHTRGEPEVVVAIIDDGFELDHPEINARGRIVSPLDVANGTSDPTPTPGADQWHGTSVLGLICADHNGKGACGVAPGCRFIPIKLDALSDDEAEARAFDHAVENGAAVINCSWGPYDGYANEPWPIPRIVELAIEHAYRSGVAVVFAAGNGSESITNDGYASSRYVIAVAASTDENKRAYYSDYGDAVWVCAPSSGGRRDIVTTDVDEGGFNPLGSYSSGFGGTSSAAPLVSGVIALMQSAYAKRHGAGSRLDVETVKRILRDTAEKIDVDGTQPIVDYWTRETKSSRYVDDGEGNLRSPAYGYGLIDAARAVIAAGQERAPRAPDAVPDRPAPPGKPFESIALAPRRVEDPLRVFHLGQADRGDRRSAKDRFESGEHIWLGDRGFDLALTSGPLAGKVDPADYHHLSRQDGTETFRYGELVALSGDFYGSPGDLYWEKRAAIPWLWEKNDLSDVKHGFGKELEAIKEQQRGNPAYPDNNVKFWWNAKSYIELALANTSHFGWHNVVAYCKHHDTALAYAREARKLLTGEPPKARELWQQAVFTNAFADHFLTDGFAAGHIRVPRAEIRAWCAARGASEKLAGALSKLLHDQDGHVETVHGQGHPLGLKDGEGLPVTNAAGARWRARCDGQLFIGKQNEQDPALAQPVAAVAASVTELFLAYLEGVEPAGEYHALRFVAFPDRGEAGLAAKFPGDLPDARIDRLVDSVRWYVKLPVIGTELDRAHIRELFGALPALMRSFRDNVAGALAADEHLRRRVPPALQEAYQKVE